MQTFYYRPQSAITPIAWSVASSVHFVTYPSLPNGIVGYEIVKVNTGNAWRSSSNTTIIPVSGTYLIDVTSCLAEAHYCGNGNSGNHGNSKTSLQQYNTLLPIILVMQLYG